MRYGQHAYKRVRASGQSAVSTVTRSGRLPDAPHSPISLSDHSGLRFLEPDVHSRKAARLFPPKGEVVNPDLRIYRHPARSPAPGRKARHIGRTDITCPLTSLYVLARAKLVARVKESPRCTQNRAVSVPAWNSEFLDGQLADVCPKRAAGPFLAWFSFPSFLFYNSLTCCEVDRITP